MTEMIYRVAYSTPESSFISFYECSVKPLVDVGMTEDQIKIAMIDVQRQISGLGEIARPAAAYMIYQLVAHKASRFSPFDEWMIPMPTPGTVVMEVAEAPHTHHPPSAAQYLIYFLLPKKQRISLLGDLNEEYLEVYNKFGRNAAAAWYWKHSLNSFWPLLWRCVVRAVQLHHWMAK